jgi:hypothetical protein
VDDIGWQPRTTQDLETYFEFLKEKEEDVWIATFKDVTKYMRQRMNAEIKDSGNGARITINLTHTLDKDLYNQDLTLKTYVSDDWNAAHIEQDGQSQNVQANTDDSGKFIMYQASPNKGPIVISKGVPEPDNLQQVTK